jgi:hypothetical protein
MFYNRFQTGGSLELYNPTNKDLLENWNFIGKCKKVYDKSAKSYMHLLDTGGLSRMNIPKDNKTPLAIIQGHIVFQIYLFSQKNFSIEISITDTQKTRHRMIFSANLRDLNMNYFTCVIPMAEVPIGTWVNLSIDVLSFVTFCFKNITFKSIDNIMFTASGKIRRIFTMRGRINDNVNKDISDNEIDNKNDINCENIPSQHVIKGINGDIEVININMNDEVCINNPILKEKFFNPKPKFKAKQYLLSNVSNIAKIYDKNKNINFKNKSHSTSKNKEKSNFKLSDKYDYNNDNDKNLNLKVTKVKDPKNSQLNDNYYTNQRYNLINKGINNTNEPIIISNGSNGTKGNPYSNSSSMKSKVTSKFNNQNYNSISSNSESQKINELLISNEEILDDKGQIYVDSNISNLNFSDKLIKESDIPKNSNFNQDMEKINNKNNEHDLLRFSSVEQIALKDSREGRPYSPPLTKVNEKNEK